jgi:hypothetical protein
MSTLPIRRVVLYKHGVGYFEREGTVTDYQPVSLTFKQREVSDVLKSLTVLDHGGGVVTAVGYESTTPVEQLLSEISLSIPDDGSLVGLLPQLKGARVAVRAVGSDNPTEGTLLGIDTADNHTTSGIAKQVRLSVLSDAGGVQTFDLFDVSVQLLDDGLKRDLDFYLKTHLAAKKKDSRTFTLMAEGGGERTLSASYVLEAPVWKATYRILLNEEGAKDPLLQGWAVVDNTSDEDWTDIDLALVAGLPVSFTHDLYTPRFIKRPNVEVKETSGVLPPTVEAGFEPMLNEFTSADMPVGAMAAPAPARMARASVKLSTGQIDRLREMERQRGASSVQTQTRERQVGDLFEYRIDKPVTVKRNQSALVPIVLKPFGGKSVLLYQKHARAENPIRCVEFNNTTGLTLEGGPLTVLDAGSYVGEAMLDTLKPTEERLVGYAVELAVRVTDSIDSRTTPVSRVVIQHGTLTTYSGQLQTTTYTFASKSDREQVVYLDHPRPSGWELIDTPNPHETTENFWRFKFTLPANKQTRFTVTCRTTYSQNWALANTSDDQFGMWVKAGYLDDKSAAAMKNVMTVRATVADYNDTLVRLDAEREKLHAEQARIRENLTSLGDRTSEKDLRERYVRTLGKQEDRLEEIEKERETATTARDEATTELNTLLGGVRYEHTM